MKKNPQDQSPATKIAKMNLSKISMSEFRKAELLAIEFHEKNHKAYQPISYVIFSAYTNKWERCGELSFLYEVALPLFNLFENNFWGRTSRDVYLNLFSGGVRPNGKWMKKFLKLYKKSTPIQQLLLSEIFNDTFDVSLDYIISINFTY